MSGELNKAWSVFADALVTAYAPKQAAHTVVLEQVEETPDPDTVEELLDLLAEEPVIEKPVIEKRADALDLSRFPLIEREPIHKLTGDFHCLHYQGDILGRVLSGVPVTKAVEDAGVKSEIGLDALLRVLAANVSTGKVLEYASDEERRTIVAAIDHARMGLAA